MTTPFIAFDQTGKRIVPVLTKEQYAVERAICDKADAHGRNSPNYAFCADNAMRGRVEQYEILTEMPATITAYIGSDNKTVNVWTGLPIGTCKETSRWRVNSHIGSTMRQYHARIGRNVYTGRGFGEGMAIVLRYSERLSL